VLSEHDEPDPVPVAVAYEVGHHALRQLEARDAAALQGRVERVHASRGVERDDEVHALAPRRRLSNATDRNGEREPEQEQCGRAEKEREGEGQLDPSPEGTGGTVRRHSDPMRPAEKTPKCEPDRQHERGNDDARVLDVDRGVAEDLPVNRAGPHR
jgi:hypothetical protein